MNNPVPLHDAEADGSTQVFVAKLNTCVPVQFWKLKKNMVIS